MGPGTRDRRATSDVAKQDRPTIASLRSVVLDEDVVEPLHLARLLQLEARVLAHRLVQAVAGDAERVLSHDQRLVDQRGQQVQRLRTGPPVDREDSLDVVDREPAGEDAQAAQEPLLRRRQQVVAPVDGRPQRLLPGQCGAASSRQEGEPVRQPIEDLLDGEHAHPHGGKLDREREAVESSTQGDDGRSVRRSQLERP